MKRVAIGAVIIVLLLLGGGSATHNVDVVSRISRE
jgi:hypothetical protein